MRTTQLVLLVPLLAGCPDRTISGVHARAGQGRDEGYPGDSRTRHRHPVPHRQLGSMKEEQASLRANFGRFIGVLETIDGGLPNVHIGVVTPNLGTTAIDGSTAPTLFGGCTDTGGERGELRTARRRWAAVPARRGSVRAAGAQTQLHAATLTQAFQQLANVGIERLRHRAAPRGGRSAHSITTRSTPASCATPRTSRSS